MRISQQEEKRAEREAEVLSKIGGGRVTTACLVYHPSIPGRQTKLQYQSGVLGREQVSENGLA